MIDRKAEELFRLCTLITRKEAINTHVSTVSDVINALTALVEQNPLVERKEHESGSFERRESDH